MKSGNLTADGNIDQSRSERPKKIPDIMKDFCRYVHLWPANMNNIKIA